MVGDEGTVVQLLGDDQPDHAREQRGVLARLHRQVDGGMLRGLGAARVDHDHVEPPLHLVAQGDERVGTRQLDPLDQERLQRVGTDEQHDVGLLDPVVPALPVAVQCAGHELGGLVDGDGRVEGRGADAVQPAQSERERHVRPRLRAVVERDGAWPVLGDDVLQPCRDLVHRRLARHLRERTVGRAPERGAQPMRIVMLFGSWRPFSQVKPCEIAWSRSPRTASTRLSATSTSIPQYAWQNRQIVVCVTVPATRHPPARFGYVMQSRSTRRRCRADSGVERMAADLSGARVLVVGSSTGIGRRIAIEAVGAGASVAFSARSRDKLESAVSEAGGGVVVVGDVRKADDCTRIVDETVTAIGGLDLVVFATGVSPLMPMEETPAETMHDVFETNAIGGLMLLTAAAGRLAEGGIVAYLGSDSVGAAYPGMVHYAASKAALDQGVDGLRMEFPETRFLRIAVGPTVGTAIALGYDAEIAARMLPQMLRFARGHGEVHDRDRSGGAHRRAARPRAAPPRHRGGGHRDPTARQARFRGAPTSGCRPRRTRRSPSPRAPARSGWTSSTPPRTGRSPPRCASG